MRVAFEQGRFRHAPLSHTTWVKKVSFICQTIMDDPPTTYDRACRAIEKLYGPCPPKK
jgi:hypothetical protein